MGIFRKLSIINKSLRYKLMLAFSLMSIIPLLACVYIISMYIFPQLENLVNVTTIIFISIIISILGLILAKGLIDPIIEMAVEAKIIAGGDYDRKISVYTDDEVGNLAQSINSMTHKIRLNLDELKNYGQRMREVNVEINKKILALSSLLQLGDLISAGTVKLDSLLELAVNKVSLIFDTGFGILYMPKDGGEDFVKRLSYNIDQERVGDLIIKKDGHSIIDKILIEQSIIVLDKSAKASKEAEKFKASYNIKNMLAIPMQFGKKVFGVLIVGNRLDDFRYKVDDIDLINIFAKQMTIAIESDILNRRTEELVIKDDLTDLYNKSFISARLEEEIKRAIFYQRPCSFIVFDIDNFKNFRDRYGELATEEVLKRMAKLLKDNIPPVGKAARTGGNEFAVLLPEKNKKEAAHIAEDIRKKIEATNLLREGKAPLTVSGGVSENPIDGTTAEELFKRATNAVKEAKSSGKNRIIA